MLLLASCASNYSYNVDGSLNTSRLDGRKLFLKTLNDNVFESTDSNDVLHGAFHFKGTIDSARIAGIFMEDEFLMPLILESGNINVNVDDLGVNVTGTALNENLFAFLKEHDKLRGEIEDLSNLPIQAILNGESEEDAWKEAARMEVMLNSRLDSLVTTTISDNFENVLAPTVFFIVTMSDPYPMQSPWIDYIMSKATDNFKQDPYVKIYCEKAKENMSIMNGMKEEMPIALPDAVDTNLAPAPTPNEMAKPEE